MRNGFTLIELSIVLVIIGLIVGGILTGRDLISAAAQRAQIAQIEKYNTAANTFRGKYGNLPGDITDPYATNFGFAARGSFAGEGDGNGIIEGNNGNAAQMNGGWFINGEMGLFWRDLSTAGLVDGSFTVATATGNPGSNVTGAALSGYMPSAKIGGNNYVYAWSGGVTSCMNGALPGNLSNGLNYYGVSGITLLATDSTLHSYPALSVLQAYNIDKKIDDGMPQAGAVQAFYLYSGSGFVSCWPAGGGAAGADDASGGPVVAGDGVSTAGSSTTCYDNGGVAGATEKYSMAQNGGNGLNCALSFRMQ